MSNPSKRIYTRTGNQAYKDYLARIKNEKNKGKKTKAKQQKPAQTSSSGFSLEDLADCYRINGIQYRNGIYQVDLAKTLLDNGASKTQDQWANYSKEAIANNQFYLGDFPLYHSLFSALFSNKDNPNYKDKIEEARTFAGKMCKNNWLMTLTRTKYKAIGKDEIIHNFGMQDQYKINENIAGLDEFVKNGSNKEVYKAILGMDDINLINQVYNWISGKDAFLWRINSKQDIECVARFNANLDRAYLDCSGYPSN